MGIHDAGVYVLIYSGAILMVYNIYLYAAFSKEFKASEAGKNASFPMWPPLMLLVSFLLGYLAVAIFMVPNYLIALILFGGSIFVFAALRLLDHTVQSVFDNEELRAELMAQAQSQEEKGRFLASMSHEMRTPLNVIIGLDEIALKTEGLTDQTRDQLIRIKLAAKHLLSLINNVLDMQRLETGDLTSAHDAFSLDEVIEDVAAISQTLADEKGLYFEANVERDVERNLVGDRPQLEQVLIAVLDNAVKYTIAPGTVRLEVHVAATDYDEEGRPCRQTLRFTVTDTGVGIDEDFLPHIFDAFSQEDASSTSRFGGGGLGLAVSKKLVEGMGGTIDVASKKSWGSTFLVTIPFDVNLDHDSDEAATDQDLIAGRFVRGTETLEGKLVLIAEDIEANAEIVSFQDMSEVMKGLRIPVYTIGYNANISALKQISDINEAASLDASTDDVTYQLRNLFNANM
jgi:signal transduction histidine kinase